MVTERTLYRVYALIVVSITLMVAVFLETYRPVPPVPSERIHSGIISAAVAAPSNEDITRVALAPAPAEPAKPATYEYVIKYGDTLTKISAMSCNPIEEIVKKNNIADADVIYARAPITLTKVESCSPVIAKKPNASPENVLRSSGASREKSFLPGSDRTVVRSARESADTLQTSRTPVQGTVANTGGMKAEDDNCANAGRGVRDATQRLLARAKCVEEKWGDHIRTTIAEVDPRIDFYRVVSVILVESSGNPRAVNHATDCHGLMQLQTPTARAFGVRRVHDPKDNIRGGIKVLASYTFEHFDGSTPHGLVAYNIGPHNGAWKYKRFHANVERFGYYREVERIRSLISANAEPPPSKEGPA